MVCVPTPAVAGLKFPADTPGPEYVPPEGAPPDSANTGVVSQTALKLASVTTGSGFTVTVTFADLLQPAVLVPVTIYVIVEPGVACTDAVLVPFRPVEGDHSHELVPDADAVSVVVLPAQMVFVPEMVIFGNAFTVTDAPEVVEHPFVRLFTVTLYVVFTVGETVGFALLDEKPAGTDDHEYVSCVVTVLFKRSVQLLIVPTSVLATSFTLNRQEPVVVPDNPLNGSSGIKLPVNGADPFVMDVLPVMLKLVLTKLLPVPPRCSQSVMKVPLGAISSRIRSPT